MRAEDYQAAMIRSEMVVPAKQHDIGTPHFQRARIPDMQTEIRDALPDTVTLARRNQGSRGNGVQKLTK